MAQLARQRRAQLLAGCIGVAWALSATGAPLLLLFIVPELAWGVVQWWPVREPA